jgi:hypothetical protein
MDALLTTRATKLVIRGYVVKSLAYGLRKDL